MCLDSLNFTDIMAEPMEVDLANNLRAQAHLAAHISSLPPPLLSSFEVDDFFLFVKEFQAYRLRGGQLPMQHLVTPGLHNVVLEAMRMEPNPFNPNNNVQFQHALATFFIPLDASKAIDRLRRIPPMDHSKKALSELVRVINSWQDELNIMAHLEFPERTLRDLFVKLLRPQRLKDLVMQSQPETVEACRLLALEHVRNMQGVLQEASLWTASVSGGGAGRQAHAAAGFTHSSSVAASSARRTHSDGRDKKRHDRHHRSAGSGGKQPQRQHIDHSSTAVATSSSAASSAQARVRACYNCGSPDHLANRCPKPRSQAKANVIAVSPSPDESTTALMKVQVFVDSDPTRLDDALIDSGATHNFVSRALADSLVAAGAKLYKHSVRAVFANGSSKDLSLALETQVRFPLLTPAYSAKARFLILEAATPHDLILGHTFLSEHRLLVPVFSALSKGSSKSSIPVGTLHGLPSQVLGDHRRNGCWEAEGGTLLSSSSYAAVETAVPRTIPALASPPPALVSSSVASSSIIPPTFLSDTYVPDSSSDPPHPEEAAVPSSADIAYARTSSPAPWQEWDADDGLLRPPLADPLELDNLGIGLQLSSATRSALATLLDEFAEVLSGDISSPAVCDEFSITLRDGADYPPMAKRRHKAPPVAAAVHAEIQALVDLDVVEPCSAACPPPVAFETVFVRKKDGSGRMCIDFKPLNDITVPMAVPLPSFRTSVERFKGARFFATLDLAKGFHQIPIAKASRPLTAFMDPSGRLWRYKRMPFGLRNASCYFQAQIEACLESHLLETCVVVYIDDLCVYTDTEEELLFNLRAVLQCLQAGGWRAKRSKCAFGVKRIEYLGHVITENKYSLSSSRISAVLAVSLPRFTKELRSFCGVVNYFHPFVPRLSLLSAPLSRVASAKGNKLIPWTEDLLSSFAAVKAAIAGAQELHIPDPSLPLFLRTDASDVGLGAVLFQRSNDGSVLPISFTSLAFDSTQRRWPTIEQEAYAILYACIKFDVFLRGRRFTIQTDHNNLRYMHKSINSKVERWHLRLQEYDFDVQHIPGVDNVVADALSRLKCDHPPSPSSALPSSVAPSSSPPGKTTPQEGEDGCVPDVSALALAVSVSSSIRNSEDVLPLEPLHQVHNAIIGHHGVDRTLKLLELAGSPLRYTRQQVSDFISHCLVCQSSSSNPTPSLHLSVTNSSQVFDVFCLDYLGPLPEVEGQKYVLVAVCAFSRFVELYPCPAATHSNAVNFVMQLWGRYGPSREIRTDGGSHFSTSLFKKAILSLGFKDHHITTPYHPQANGIVERVNREFLRHIRSLLLNDRLSYQPPGKEELTWLQAIPLVQRIINSSPSAATGVAPVTAVFGLRVLPHRHVLVGPTPEGFDPPSSSPSTDASDVHLALDSNILAHAVRNQGKYNERRINASPPESTRTFAPNDLVLLSPPSRKNKLDMPLRGPFLVVARLNGNTYSLKSVTSDKTLRHHVSSLVPFKGTLDAARRLAAAADDEWVVERIDSHLCRDKDKNNFRRWQYIVYWEGYSEPTTEPYKHVAQCKALDDYLQAVRPDLLAREAQGQRNG